MREAVHEGQDTQPTSGGPFVGHENRSPILIGSAQIPIFRRRFTSVCNAPNCRFDKRVAGWLGTPMKRAEQGFTEEGSDPNSANHRTSYACTPSYDLAALRAPSGPLCAAVRIWLVPIYGTNPDFACGSFDIKGRRNSRKLFVPCRHPAQCAPPLRQVPNRIDSMVTSESTLCSMNHGPVPCF